MVGLLLRLMKVHNQNNEHGMVILVRLYAHYAIATFLHKFAQALPSSYRQR